MTQPLKFYEKGIFKSKKRATAYAERLRSAGKTVRIEKHTLPTNRGSPFTGVWYSIRVKSKHDFFGRNYHIDTKTE